jgi:hypothetical protein
MKNQKLLRFLCGFALGLFITIVLFMCSDLGRSKETPKTEVQRKVYYVTPRGKDSNDGLDTTSAHAWLTWKKAFDTVEPGDTVYFKKGFYSPLTKYSAIKSNIEKIGEINVNISFYSIYKVKVDTSEYIIVAGYQSVAIVKHK